MSQLVCLGLGPGLGILGLTWHALGAGPVFIIIAGYVLVATGFLLFGVIAIGTFRSRLDQRGVSASVPLVTRPARPRR